MPWKSVVYKRSDLYTEVWREPVRSIAEKYGISDVALAQICRKLDVPLPGRGYWARKAAGQDVPKTPLPPLKRGLAERPFFASSIRRDLADQRTG